MIAIELPALTYIRVRYHQGDEILQTDTAIQSWISQQGYKPWKPQGMVSEDFLPVKLEEYQRAHKSE